MPFLRLVFSFTLIACTLACGREPGQEAGTPKPAAFVSDGAGDGSVWVVDGPKGGRLYLCGTIHILREKDYPLAPAYEAAYMYSNKLVLELPPGSSGPELTNRMAQLGMYPKGMSLEETVGKETWEKVNQWATKRGMDPAAMNRFRPWFAALLMTSMEYAALGASADKGVDVHFEERARKDGKPMEGLETGEFQIQLFASLTEKQQKELLEQTLGEIATVAEVFEKLLAAWKQGDLKALQEMLFSEAEKYPDLMSLFLTARNVAWMEPLDRMLKNGEKVMVLVGTGHFPSEGGLIELLRLRGYKVRHYRDVTDF
ncbi:MAG TPA: TraB/GumN family protein [Prosthecobacter sp.]